MPRVPYVQIEDAKAGDLALLNLEIVRLRGRILSLHRVLANNPPALRAFMVMSRYVRDESTLTSEMRELAILGVAHALGDNYELHQHEVIARGAGITDAQLKEFVNWQHSTSFTDQQRAVIGFAQEATLKHQLSDSTYGQVAAFLSPAEVVDLALTVGWYHLCHVLIEGLGVEVEPPEI